jgi:CRISPR/Cas system endoribonuclease Cas6 (RAMP superfamily)
MPERARLQPQLAATGNGAVIVTAGAAGFDATDVSDLDVSGFAAALLSIAEFSTFDASTGFGSVCGNSFAIVSDGRASGSGM